MVLYDFLAPAYDPVFASIYRPFREKAFASVPKLDGAAVLELACGTGQNFPLLAPRLGKKGHIIGVDVSAAMLRRARACANREGLLNTTLIQLDAAGFSIAALHAATGRTEVDFILATWALTSMREWRTAFRNAWGLLKPGGEVLILDVDAAKGNLHAGLVAALTRSHFTSQVWQPLQDACLDFRMDYLEPSAHLFGGRLFVARGTKPAAPRSPTCPS